MSRGLGKVEQAILQALQDLREKGLPGRCSVAGLVLIVYGQSQFATLLHQPPSVEKGYSSIKRATKSLDRKGLIHRYTNGHKAWVELKDKCTPANGTLTE